MPAKGNVVGSYGSPSWTFNQLRTDGLVHLLNDLATREQTGFDKPHCDLTKELLSQAVNCATTIPDSIFLTTPIWKRMKKFETLYHSWNDDCEGSDCRSVEHRRKIYAKLQKARHKLAATCRKNVAILDNNLDTEAVMCFYQAMGKMVNSAPDIFVNLSKCFSRKKL